MTHTLLRIDSSARSADSKTRALTDQVAARFAADETITRDLAATPIPHITQDWVAANFTPVDARSEAQRAELALSDSLIGELQAADTIVIGVPLYNFGVPAALKAWIDQVARAGVTFKYTEGGPKGLLENKRAVVVVASGGVKLRSEVDFATDYITHVLGFIGITDVQVVGADQLVANPEAAMAGAEKAVADLAL